MLAKVVSGANVGLETVPVTVEVDVAAMGLPSITIVGLASKAVDEAKERVRAAMRNSSAEFPVKRVTINLAPADLPKEGPLYDLPIALGLMLASGQVDADISDTLVFGELSLDGSVKHVKGALPLAMMARDKKINRVFLPADNAQEVSIVKGVEFFPVSNLKELIGHLIGMLQIAPVKTISFAKLKKKTEAEFDFCDVYGQETAKRALEIAAAGGHNLFMHGSPGAGKTMMARAFAGILPCLAENEAVEVTKIYSVTGNISADETMITTRPFRSPHHTTSRIGLIGGGSKPASGEISLAHRGVLFLDEFPEFPRSVLESLRQPMEDGVVSISRASGTVRFPARFILVAAANPCPCGYRGSKKKQCSCLPGQINRYQKKISGPILDRIDLHIEVPEVPVKKMTGKFIAETSKNIQQRVEKAREIQQHRYKDTKVMCNAELSTRMIKKFCVLEKKVQELLIRAANNLSLSARSYYKVIKVGRTIADLENETKIQSAHIGEALQYRPRNNKD